jgi:hypothetical protein
MDEQMKDAVATLIDHIERLNLAALAQNEVLKSHNKILQSHAKRVAFLEDMLLKQEGAGQ